MNKKQKQTLNKILEKPERSDIPWADIESLIIALGGEISEGGFNLSALTEKFSQPYYLGPFFQYRRMSYELD